MKYYSFGNLYTVNGGGYDTARIASSFAAGIQANKADALHILAAKDTYRRRAAALDLGELNRDDLKPFRFKMLFGTIGAEPCDLSEVNFTYEHKLSQCSFLLDGS